MGIKINSFSRILCEPALARLETSGEDDSVCSMDQMSVSSTYLNLDALSLSSEEDSQDLAERSDLSVTLFCSSEEAGTRVNSDQVSSDEDFHAESGMRDIRQIVQRCASPPGGQIIGAAQDDRQYEPPAPVVDLVTGKCKPGKVSRTVSTTPLTLDLIVVCTSGVKVPPPGVSTQVVLPPATVASTVTAIGMNTPVVAAPAPVVEQLEIHAGELPKLQLPESPRVASVVQTVVLVSLAYAAVGSSRGLVAALFAQTCSGGALSGCSGRGQFVQCVIAFTRTLLSASSREQVASG